MSTSTQHFPDAAQASERRLHNRVFPKSLIYVACGQNNGGMVLNAGEDGLAISMAIAVGDEAYSRLNVRMNGLAHPIEVQGRMVWATRSKKRAGVQLLEVSDEQREQIREWLVLDGIRDINLTPRQESEKTVTTPVALPAAAAAQIALVEPVLAAPTLAQPHFTVPNPPEPRFVEPSSLLEVFGGTPPESLGPAVAENFASSGTPAAALPSQSFDPVNPSGFRDNEWDLASVTLVPRKKPESRGLSALALVLLWIAIPAFGIGVLVGRRPLERWLSGAESRARRTPAETAPSTKSVALQEEPVFGPNENEEVIDDSGNVVLAPSFVEPPALSKPGDVNPANSGESRESRLLNSMSTQEALAFKNVKPVVPPAAGTGQSSSQPAAEPPAPLVAREAASPAPTSSAATYPAATSPAATSPVATSPGATSPAASSPAANPQNALATPADNYADRSKATPLAPSTVSSDLRRNSVKPSSTPSNSSTGRKMIAKAKSFWPIHIWSHPDPAIQAEPPALAPQPASKNSVVTTAKTSPPPAPPAKSSPPARSPAPASTFSSSKSAPVSQPSTPAAAKTSPSTVATAAPKASPAPPATSTAKLPASTPAPATASNAPSAVTTSASGSNASLAPAPSPQSTAASSSSQPAPRVALPSPGSGAAIGGSSAPGNYEPVRSAYSGNNPGTYQSHSSSRYPNRNEPRSGPRSSSTLSASNPGYAPQPRSSDTLAAPSSPRSVPAGYAPSLAPVKAAPPLHGVMLIARKSDSAFVLRLPEESIPGASRIASMRMQRFVMMPQQSLWHHHGAIAKVTVGDLVAHAAPEKPDAKVQPRTGESVTVRAFLDKNGNVADLKPVSGRYALMPRVMRTLRDWQFDQTLVDGKPVESQVNVTVDFHPES